MIKRMDHPQSLNDERNFTHNTRFGYTGETTRIFTGRSPYAAAHNREQQQQQQRPTCRIALYLFAKRIVHSRSLRIKIELTLKIN